MADSPASIPVNRVDVPDYGQLFSLIRAAGPSNAAKARAVDNALSGVRQYLEANARISSDSHGSAEP